MPTLREQILLAVFPTPDAKPTPENVKAVRFKYRNLISTDNFKLLMRARGISRRRCGGWTRKQRPGRWKNGLSGSPVERLDKIR